MFLKHVDDALAGLATVAENLGVFRSSAVPVSVVLPAAEPTPAEHNSEMLRSRFPKEQLLVAKFPAGTVVWWQDPVVSEFRAREADARSMTNEAFFREGSHSTWYINARCRFYLNISRTPRGIEVALYMYVHVVCACLQEFRDRLCSMWKPGPSISIGTTCRGSGSLSRSRDSILWGARTFALRSAKFPAI